MSGSGFDNKQEENMDDVGNSEFISPASPATMDDDEPAEDESFGYNYDDDEKFNELELTHEELELIRTNPLLGDICRRAVTKMQDLQDVIQERDLSLYEASKYLEQVLMSQGDVQVSTEKYETLFHTARREREDLRLQCVKLQSELESMRKTAGCAISAIGKRELRNELTNSGNSINNTTSNDLDSMNQDQESKKESEEKNNDYFGDIATLLEDMTRKMQIESEDAEIEAPLTLEFLEKLYRHKTAELKTLQSQLQILEGDIKQMRVKVEEYKKKRASKSSSKRVLGKRKQLDRTASEEKQEAIIKRSKIFDDRFTSDLESAYFSARTSSDNPDNALKTFSQHLSTFSRFSKLEPLVTLAYVPQINHTETLLSRISKIELDKDEDYFAVGGDLREIQVFPYSVDINSNNGGGAGGVGADTSLNPLQVMCTTNCVTDLSWSKLTRGQIASGDSNGIVTLWDASTASQLTTFNEHQGKILSVDYSHTEAGILASGSEDTTVRVWDVRLPEDAGQRSVCVIHSAAAVCALRFNPTKDNELVFGAANNLTYYYDTRKPEHPVHVLTEHSNAICGVSFHRHNEVITQSIDGTIKLWDLNKPDASVRTFEGHKNQKTFVGLSAKRDHIATGSEDNSVYVYNLQVSTPILAHSFNSGIKEQDANRAVSAVCWNKHANIIISGNDCGIIKILKLSSPEVY